MALIGEAVVEEWLNRQGFFTIRGIKLGVQEIDILAVKLNQDGTHDCRHIEVQISTNPISYISNVPKKAQTASTKANSAKKRTISELRQGVSEWIEKKFDHPDKKVLKNKLCAEGWTRELVVHKVRHQEELELLSEAGINVIGFETILGELKQTLGPVAGASGKEVLELMMLLDELKR